MAAQLLDDPGNEAAVIAVGKDHQAIVHYLHQVAGLIGLHAAGGADFGNGIRIPAGNRRLDSLCRLSLVHPDRIAASPAAGQAATPGEFSLAAVAPCLPPSFNAFFRHASWRPGEFRADLSQSGYADGRTEVLCPVGRG